MVPATIDIIGLRPVVKPNHHHSLICYFQRISIPCGNGHVSRSFSDRLGLHNLRDVAFNDIMVVNMDMNLTRDSMDVP